MGTEERFIVDHLRKVSNKAVWRGHEFPGFMGSPASAYNKEGLIMLLNVLYDMYLLEIEGSHNPHMISPQFTKL